jgi:hypothetical protein
VAAILWTDVTGFFPNDTFLASVPVAAQTVILSYVNTEMSVAFFGGDENGTKLRLARIYFAAHLGIMGTFHGNVGTVAGPLTSESEGDLSRTYATLFNANMRVLHPQTGYGQLFDLLLASSPMRIGVTS